MPQFVTDTTEDGQSLFVRAFCGSRIVKALMDADTVTRKDRARLVRVIAHGEDLVERFPGKLVHSLGPVAREVAFHTLCLTRVL